MRYFYVLTLELAISCGLGVSAVWIKPEFTANAFLTILFIVLYVLFLAKLIFDLCKSAKQIKAHQNKAFWRTGTLYEAINYEEDPWSKSVIAIFILKRVTFTTLCLLLMPGIEITIPYRTVYQRWNYSIAVEPEIIYL